MKAVRGFSRNLPVLGERKRRASFRRSNGGVPEALNPNLDLATEFLQSYALTEEGLTAMDHAKPIGVPALISLYEKVAPDGPNLRPLEAVVDAGQVMPNILDAVRPF